MINIRRRHPATIQANLHNRFAVKNKVKFLYNANNKLKPNNHLQFRSKLKRWSKIKAKTCKVL